MPGVALTRTPSRPTRATHAMGWASAGAPWGAVGAIRPRRVCWVPGGRPGAAHSLTGARAPARSLAAPAPRRPRAQTEVTADVRRGAKPSFVVEYDDGRRLEFDGVASNVVRTVLKVRDASQL